MSVLNSLLVIISNVDGRANGMKSCLISGSLSPRVRRLVTYYPSIFARYPHYRLFLCNAGILVSNTFYMYLISFRQVIVVVNRSWF